jgi:hypothetical protein
LDVSVGAEQVGRKTADGERRNRTGPRHWFERTDATK